MNIIQVMPGAPKSYVPFPGQEIAFLNLHPLEVI